MKTIRIGNGAGFWGDNLDAPRLLAEQAGVGGLQYLTLEYLAELTMSILAHLRSRDPLAGYVTDFPAVVESLVPQLQRDPVLRIVTNAGGMNPQACAAKVSQILAANGLADTTVAAVSGDDLLPEFDGHRAAGQTFSNMETGKALESLGNKIVCANAYLGATGIVDALQQNARIVITGRVADASLTVGPAIHEFGWDWDDWNRLGSATVAGHLIECGAQATGGMYSDWTDAIKLGNVGYPIVELAEDGTSVVTKPAGTGGAVTVGTVAEQLVYEIGDPAHYLTPDVDADFAQVRLEQIDENRVRVTGAAGNPRPEEYKVSLAYADGYRTAGTLVITGRNAEEKARHCGEAILARLRAAGCEPQQTLAECLGTGDSLPGVWPRDTEPWEVVLRIAARDPSREVIERFSREFAPLVTSGPPGVTGYTGGRAKPIPVLSYWPTTISRDRVQAIVEVQTAKEWTA